MRIALVSVLLILGGCASTSTPDLPTETKLPIGKPCMKREDVPVKPSFVTEQQLKALRGDSFVTTLYAERLARIDYEERLEALIPGCVEGGVPIPAGLKPPQPAPTKRPWEFWKP